jgi:type IV pilus assembly protein PilE
MKRTYRVSEQAGFTLIELLVTIAIVAILATLAYSSYQDQIVRSRRAAGAVCLQERAQLLERFYSQNLTYLGAAAPAPCDPDVAPHYAVSFAVAPAAATPRAYRLQIVPQGAQATRDTLCGTLTLDQAGVRGEGGTAANASECW